MKNYNRQRWLAVTALCLASACAKDASDPVPQPLGASKLLILSAPDPDTVLSLAPKPLVVQIVDAAGKPLANTLISFTAHPQTVFSFGNLGVAAAIGGQFTDSLAVNTGSDGKASVYLHYSNSTSGSDITVSSAAVANPTVVPITVLPGAATDISFGGGGGVYVGEKKEFFAFVIDRWRNRRTDPVQIRAITGKV
jgi:hypothetical protein